MAWYRTLNGTNITPSSDTPATLVLEAYEEENDVDNQYPRQTWDDNNYENTYFSYSNYKWTAQKDFNGLVILVLATYRQAAAATTGTYFTAEVVRDNPIQSQGGTIVVAGLRPSIYTNAPGLQAIEWAYLKIKQGDQIKCGKENGFGWDSAYLYVFEADEATAVLDGANISFTSNVGKTVLEDYFTLQ